MCFRGGKLYIYICHCNDFYNWQVQPEQLYYVVKKIFDGLQDLIESMGFSKFEKIYSFLKLFMKVQENYIFCYFLIMLNVTESPVRSKLQGKIVCSRCRFLWKWMTFHDHVFQLNLTSPYVDIEMFFSG